MVAPDDFRKQLATIRTPGLSWIDMPRVSGHANDDGEKPEKRIRLMFAEFDARAALGVCVHLLSCLGGFVIGLSLAKKALGRYRGFEAGLIGGSLFALLGALMCGNLLAGWLESTLGLEIGVPLGLFVGGVVGAVLIGSATGGVGVLVRSLISES